MRPQPSLIAGLTANSEPMLDLSDGMDEMCIVSVLLW
jgi:hypothetical protein